MSTPEVQAAVERATRDPDILAGILRATATIAPPSLDNFTRLNDSARELLIEASAALSEANERASILQTALHERTVERDEARKALASPPPPKGEALPVVSEDWEPPAWTHGLVPARPSPRVSREEVARIIDGGAFNAAEDAINYHERYPEDGPWFVMSCAGDALHAVQWAYAKADTILALLSRGEG